MQSYIMIAFGIFLIGWGIWTGKFKVSILEAKVLSKDVMSSVQKRTGENILRYKVQFDTEKGVKTLLVDADIYDTIVVNKRGILTLKGADFQSFK